MSQIPGLFQYRAEQGKNSGLQPFSYSQEAQMFSIGGAIITLAEFDPDTYPGMTDLGINPEGVPANEMLDHPALLPDFGSLIVGPKLHRWAESHPEVVSKASEVMAEAYAAFENEPPTTHIGFDSGLREHGGIGLRVLGNYATLEPNLYGMQIEGLFEHGFAEYYLHNTFSQQQRASLYAGMGHLATLADSEE